MSRSSKPRQKHGKRPRKAGPSKGHVLIAKAIGEAARLVSAELRAIVLVLNTKTFGEDWTK